MNFFDLYLQTDMHIESKNPDTRLVFPASAVPHEKKKEKKIGNLLNYATGSRRLLCQTHAVCKSEWPIKIMKLIKLLVHN